MSDYDLDYIGPSLAVGIIFSFVVALIIDLAILKTPRGNYIATFKIMGLTLLIIIPLFLCICSFIYNTKKQALKLSGITLGIVFGILSIIFFFIDYKLNWLFLILTIAIGEIIYWLDNKKPKKQDNKILFTAGRKSLAMLYSGVILVVIVGGYSLIIRIEKFLINYDYIILKWLGYIGVGLVGLGIALSVIYMYLWLNSLKYRK